MADDAARALDLARRVGVTVGVAESLTGGLVAAALTAVPGASEVVVGGVVAYAPEVKRAFLGVPAGLLDSPGPVSGPVALAMAHGARAALGCDVAVATTGVAGPDSHGGRPPGTVWVAAVGVGVEIVREERVPGGRDDVRRGAVDHAISSLCDLCDALSSPGTPVG